MSGVIKYYCGISGLGSITANLEPFGSETGSDAAEVAMAEIGSTGIYSGTKPALAGEYWAYLTGGMVGGGRVNLTADGTDNNIQADGATAQTCDDKASAIPGLLTALQAHGDANWESPGGASVSAIVAALSGLPIVLQPAYDPTTGALTLIRCRDYATSEGRSITWTVPPALDLSPVSTAISLRIYRPGKTQVTIAGTIANAGTSTQSITFQPTKSQLTIPAADLSAPYIFEAVATFANGDLVSAVGPGPCVVVQNAGP